jgi:dolichol-phosphate mannosyltransferase
MTEKLIIIPAHNEEETIRDVVTAALKYADVSVTDDGSRDRTAAILHELADECKNSGHPHKLNIITHPVATHIPQGVQDGFRFGVRNGYGFFVTMDAGLSHDPHALPGFFNYNQDIDVVIGRRQNTQNVPLYRKTISWMASRVVNYALTESYFNFFGPGITDCTSGFRRYSSRAAKKIADSHLQSIMFDFHMEALALCVRSGMSVAEIPIRYVFSNSSFNKRVLRQAMKFALYLLRTKKVQVHSGDPSSLH